MALPAATAFAGCSGRLVDAAEIRNSPICVPDAPQRIATLDPFYTLLMALNLDAPVTATTLSGPVLPEGVPADIRDSISDLGQMTSPNLEAIISANPDLIIGSSFGLEKLAPTLSRIAPTVLIDTTDWRRYLMVMAEAANRLPQAQYQLDALEKEIAELRDALPVRAKVSFLRIVPGGFQVYVDGPAAYAPLRLLSELGIERPPYETATDNTVLRRPTLEGLFELQGDTLIYTIGGAHHEGDAAALEKEVTETAIWQALPAVKSGRAYRVEPRHWMGFGGIPSARAILADLRHIYGIDP